MTNPLGPKLPEPSQAGETFSAEGERISKGKEKSRYKVMGEEGDTRMMIAAKQSLVKPDMSVMDRLRNQIRAVRHVKYENVDLNIRSLAKRLHISKAEIREASKTGNVASLIESRQSERLDKALNYYEKVFAHRELFGAGGLSTRTLMDVTKTGLSILLRSSGRAKEGEGKMETFNLGRHSFNVDTTTNHPDLLNIAVFGKRLGEGHFGKVTAEMRLDKPQERTVLKETKGSRTDTEQALRNEVAILRRFEDPSIQFIVGADGKAAGIEEAPELYAVLSGTTQAVACRKKYADSGDLKNAFKAPMEDKMEIARQLLAGGANLKRANVAHADIKPDNILLRSGSDGKLVAFLSDFGSALKIPNVSGRAAISDLRYVPTALASRSDDAALAARDRYAMGKTLFEFFVGTSTTRAFRFGPKQIGVDVHVPQLQKEMNRAGVPKNMQDVIIALMDINNTTDFAQHLRALPLGIAKQWGEHLIKARFAEQIYNNPKKEGLKRREVAHRKEKARALLTDNVNKYNLLKNDINMVFNTKNGQLPPSMRKRAMDYGHALLSLESARMQKRPPHVISNLERNLAYAEKLLEEAARAFAESPRQAVSIPKKNR